jgi:hypothetical protein
MPATRTGLRRVAWVDSHHLATLGRGLVGQKRPKPSETPRVQTASSCLTAPLRATADISKILHDNHSAGLDGIDDTPTQSVVAVAPETVDLPSQLFEVSLGRAGAFALKTATEPEVPAFDLLPATFSKEPIIGTDGWTGNPQVHTNDIARWSELYIWKCNGNMQPEPSFAVDQVSTVKLDSPFQEVAGVRIYGKRHLDPTSHRGQADDTLLQFDGVRTRIVPDWCKCGDWTGNFAPPLPQHEGGFHRLSCPNTRRNDQLCRKAGKLFSKPTVGCMVQPNTVPFPMLPSVGSNGVETRRVLAQRFQERTGLLWVRSNVQAYGPPHTRTPYYHTIAKKSRCLPSTEA